MFESAYEPSSRGTWSASANVALKPGSSQQGKVSRADVASCCVVAIECSAPSVPVKREW
jgi:hypothetical protein